MARDYDNRNSRMMGSAHSVSEEHHDFFPSKPKKMDFKKCMPIKGFEYPDTQQAIYDAQEKSVKAADKASRGNSRRG